jgi:hypothetical protein
MYNNGGNSWAGYMNNRYSSPYINMLEGYARNYMDPNSPYNMKQFAGLRGEGRSAAGQQFNQGMKMSAAGQNPFANQQYQGAMRSNVDSAMMARNQQTNTNQQLGQGMLGMGMQARATQAGMSQQQQQWDREYKQHEKGQWMGLAGTLLTAGISGPLAASMMPPTEINAGTEVTIPPTESPKATTPFINTIGSWNNTERMYDMSGKYPNLPWKDLGPMYQYGYENFENIMSPTELELDKFKGTWGAPWEDLTYAINLYQQDRSPFWKPIPAYPGDLKNILDTKLSPLGIRQQPNNVGNNYDAVPYLNNLMDSYDPQSSPVDRVSMLGKLAESRRLASLTPLERNMEEAKKRFPIRDQYFDNESPWTTGLNPDMRFREYGGAYWDRNERYNVGRETDESLSAPQAPLNNSLSGARAWAKSAGLSNADNMTLEKAQYWWDKWNPKKKGEYPWGNR